MTQKALVATGDLEYNLGEVEQRSIPQLTPDTILVKVVAYAANPTDWKHLVFQLGGKGVILGSDSAGVVQDVGKNVKGFKKGDVVSNFQRGGFFKESGAFQEYILANPFTTIKYNPDQIKSSALPQGDTPSGTILTFEGAASVTLGLSTVGLSFAYWLGLDATDASNKDKYILIWGGATATGVLAIQIAKSVYNLKVLTTASKKHHSFLKSLGAEAVFDYNDTDVVSQIVKYGQGNIVYGLDTVSDQETFQSLYDATAGSSETFLDNLLMLLADKIKTDNSRKVHYGSTLAYVALGADAPFGPVTIKWSQELQDKYNHFWTELLPTVLPTIKTSNLKVLKSGLETANEALSLLRENKVSGEKIVWRL